MANMAVTFGVQYQFLSKSATRPTDYGSAHSVEFSSGEGFGVLPAVGDYVQLIPIGLGDSYPTIEGKIKSRLFRQFTRGETDGVYIGVTIVVEETDDDFSLLIKE